MGGFWLTIPPPSSPFAPLASFSSGTYKGYRSEHVSTQARQRHSPIADCARSGWPRSPFLNAFAVPIPSRLPTCSAYPFALVVERGFDGGPGSGMPGRLGLLRGWLGLRGKR